MDIGAVKNSLDLGTSAFVTQTGSRPQSVANVQTGQIINQADPAATLSTDGLAKTKPDLEDVTQMTEVMNKFVQAMNANIRFTIHEKSNQLIVQVVDQANNIVLKEFPSHEFLDTVAAIRDYVGILLDKKI